MNEKWDSWLVKITTIHLYIKFEKQMYIPLKFFRILIIIFTFFKKEFN